jgi:uncharacterized protein YciI
VSTMKNGNDMVPRVSRMSFLTDSLAIFFSALRSLSADRSLMVGHAICIDSNTVEGAKELLSREPILMALTNELERDIDSSEVIFEIPKTSPDDENHKARYPRADVSNIGFFRWKHIKHYSLRQDDGMSSPDNEYMTPTLIISFDHDPSKEIADLRANTNTSHVEYLMESEQVVMGGPFHQVMGDGEAESATAVGNIMVVNTPGREHAIRFAEDDPCAKVGLYQTIRIHDFNNLDVTGKYVLQNKLHPNEFDHVKDAMDQWGYPVGDDLTAWLNR